MLFLKTSSGSENKPAWGGSLPMVVSALDSGAGRGGGDRRQQGDATAPCFCFCSMEPELRGGHGLWLSSGHKDPGAIREAT